MMLQMMWRITRVIEGSHLHGMHKLQRNDPCHMHMSRSLSPLAIPPLLMTKGEKYNSAGCHKVAGIGTQVCHVACANPTVRPPTLSVVKCTDHDCISLLDI
jgi:hypothetical protein